MLFLYNSYNVPMIRTDTTSYIKSAKVLFQTLQISVGLRML